MWHSGYCREESNDGFQMSPCLTASSGLLTPPSSYNIDARRNSAASSLSSLGPTTPIYGRNPFSDHNYVAVAAIDERQDESLESLAMGYSFKAPGSENASFDSWSTLGNSNGIGHALPLRMHDNFSSNQNLIQAHMATFSGVDSLTSSLPSSCTSSFNSLPYTDFQSHLNDAADGMSMGEPSQPMWSCQYAMEHMMAAPTMAPSESLLGGEYVQVNSSDPDADMGAYDDADIPLAPSPQEVIVKHEDREVSDDERRVRRSIYVSSTGGKTVMREQQPRTQNKKAKRSSSKATSIDWNGRYGINICLKNLEDVERIPGTKRCRRIGGGLSGTPHVCKYDTDGKPCGRKFVRQEHLHRHEKTHSGLKLYGCQICPRLFNRNDNCWEHYWTHVRRPGKKDGRNAKSSLRRVLRFISDPKHIDKLHNKWLKEVGYEYDPQRDPMIEEEETDDEVLSPTAIKEEDDYRSPSITQQEDCVIRCRL